MILKRILSVILTVCIVSMSFSYLVSVNAQTKDGQSSMQTAESPNIENERNDHTEQSKQGEFAINNKEDFSDFITNPKRWEDNYKITLTCDIDMSGKTFNPIETFNGQFDGGGHIDGGGHTISNLKIQGSSSQNKNFKLAFIKTLGSDATFENVTFDNYTIEDGSNVKNITYQAAGFVLNNYGKVSGVKIRNGTMKNINHAKNGDAAGFVRINEKGGKINNCLVNKNEGKDIFDIFKKSNINAGFVSYNFGTIGVCITNLPVNYGKNSGGFVSENFGTINECTSEGEVTGKNCLGGFCGYNKGLLDNEGEGIIENCISKGNVTANTSKSQVICGGFVGQN
ncbi:MAG: hypothetical protein K2G97_01495, partial [Oscillospiraceae bacterium]|nr:hypothetical protein [Oscillospiraceae bacterium]